MKENFGLTTPQGQRPLSIKTRIKTVPNSVLKQFSRSTGFNILQIQADINGWATEHSELDRLPSLTELKEYQERLGYLWPIQTAMENIQQTSNNKDFTDEDRQDLTRQTVKQAAKAIVIPTGGKVHAERGDVENYLKEHGLGGMQQPSVEVYHGKWTREDVERQTDKVFLFGDNTDDRQNTHHIPTSTQAVVRGLPNAIGIDTKKDRGTSDSSYFTDDDFDTFKAQVDSAIRQAVNSGKTIVIPEGGIGTGKAMLQQKAPKLYQYLQEQLDKLKNGKYRNNVDFSIGLSLNSEVSPQEKNAIRKELYKLDRAGRDLITVGDNLYLLDHTDRDGIDEGKGDGFSVKAIIPIGDMDREEIETFKTEIEDGNIRNQEDVNSWFKEHSDKQGYHSSDNIDAEDRRSNDDYAGLGSQTSQGETRRRQSTQNSAENLGTGQVKTGWDGSTHPRYVDRNIQEFHTPTGEVYGFVTPEGDMYLDPDVITPQHPIHEYTHLWDRAVKARNPELSARGKELITPCYFHGFVQFN